jgi:hypothetical protein
MNNENLPIFKATLDLCVYLDLIVKNQDRYYKYSIGFDLRKDAKEILFLINRANRAKDAKRVIFLEQLVNKSEDLKTTLILAKELKALKSFTQFEHSSKLVINVCRQAQAWLNSSAGMLR